MKMRGISIRIAAGFVLAAAVTIVWAAGAVRATPEMARGLSAGTSKLDRAPKANPSEELGRRVAELARFAGSSPASAVAGLRRARAGVGQTNADIFAFRNDRGRACIVVLEWIGFCEPDEGSSTPGLDWSIGGGDADTPSRLIAVYSDDVVRVSLAVDGNAVPVSMANNVAYAEFPSTAGLATFTAFRADGRSNSVDISLQG
jgi:hypothetical protein